MKLASVVTVSEESLQPSSAIMSNKPTPATRRNITDKGTSMECGRRCATLRRSLLAAVLLPALAGCASTKEVQTTTTMSATELTTTLAPTTTLAATTTSAVTTTIMTATTVISASTTESASKPQPTLVVSQTAGLDPKGTLVTVRGTGFDITKGVYVFVCNQVKWDANRRCVGGVNLDGSSPLSQWISSNPPAYAKGLTIPYKLNGSFVVPLLVRAVDETTKLIDCSIEQCGVVAFADHTRRDDRSQDVFVSISFTPKP